MAAARELGAQEAEAALRRLVAVVAQPDGSADWYACRRCGYNTRDLWRLMRHLTRPRRDGCWAAPKGAPARPPLRVAWREWWLGRGRGRERGSDDGDADADGDALRA